MIENKFSINTETRLMWGLLGFFKNAENIAEVVGDFNRHYTAAERVFEKLKKEQKTHATITHELFLEFLVNEMTEHPACDIDPAFVARFSGQPVGVTWLKWKAALLRQPDFLFELVRVGPGHVRVVFGPDDGQKHRETVKRDLADFIKTNIR
jgi:hypothetical protein